MTAPRHRWPAWVRWPLAVSLTPFLIIAGLILLAAVLGGVGWAGEHLIAYLATFSAWAAIKVTFSIVCLLIGIGIIAALIADSLP